MPPIRQLKVYDFPIEKMVQISQDALLCNTLDKIRDEVHNIMNNQEKIKKDHDYLLSDITQSFILSSMIGLSAYSGAIPPKYKIFTYGVAALIIPYTCISRIDAFKYSSEKHYKNKLISYDIYSVSRKCNYFDVDTNKLSEQDRILINKSIKSGLALIADN